MRLLLPPCNTTEKMTHVMADVSRATAGRDAEILPRTATIGFPNIASCSEAQITGANVVETIAAHRHDVHAVILPRPTAADLPMMGTAETAVMATARLAGHFWVVTFSPRMARWYDACMRRTRLGARFAGVVCPKTSSDTLDNVAVTPHVDLIALPQEATATDIAEWVIPDSAPLAGFAPQIADEALGFLADLTAAATTQALALAPLSARCRNRNARPPGRPSVHRVGTESERRYRRKSACSIVPFSLPHASSAHAAHCTATSSRAVSQHQAATCKVRKPSTPQTSSPCPGGVIAMCTSRSLRGLV